MEKENIEKLLTKQRKYFATGETLSPSYRKAALKKLYDNIVAMEPEINEAIKKDLGKSAAETYMVETGMALAEIHDQIKHVKKWSKDKTVSTPLAQFRSHSFIRKSPYGCVLIMSPWNYPFMLTIEPLADAISAGNTVIVKPSAYSPSTSAVMDKLIKATFKPEHVTTVLGGREENKALLDMPFNKIFFTGSQAVGKEVMRHAADRLIPVTLELGGKSPCIVDKSAKIPLAAKRIAFGKFLNLGQTCVAPDYVLVQESVKDKFLKELKKQISLQFGKYPLENANYGKMISQKHYDRVLGLIDEEKIYTGGDKEDGTLRIAPTVLKDCSWDDKAMQEEIFGPVLPVISYKTTDEIVDKINSRDTPLALYIFSSDKKNIKYITTHVAFGGGCVNDTVIHLSTATLPFGGCGQSGMGAYHGKAGFDCFTHNKSILDKKTWIDMPMRYQPYSRIKDKLVRLFLR